ncbi:FliH/SctL family protein [Lachnospiraceae bacterium LCP25S3_G4]
MYSIFKGNNLKKEIKPYQYCADFFEEDNLKEVLEQEEVPKHQSSADVLIGEALEKAQTILNAAREQAEELKKEAYETASRTGYDDGYQQGYQKAYEDHQALMEKEWKQFEEDMIDSINEMEVQKAKVLETHMNDLKNICVTIAEKVIKTSLKSSDEIIKRMIVSATEKLKKSQWAKIYIAGTDSTRMVKGDSDLLHSLAHLSDNIKVIVMDNEEEGNCIIELPNEIIDVSVNTQLQNIKDILNDARL